MLMVAIFVSYEGFSCPSKSYELCAVQANILVLQVLKCSLVIALVFSVKICTKTNVDGFNENDEQCSVNCELCSSLCVS